MIVTFSPRFPAKYRFHIEQMIQTCAEAWELRNGWECYVTLAVSKGLDAEINIRLEVHGCRLDLRKSRLDDPAFGMDIVHELYHIIDCRTDNAINALPAELRKPLVAVFEEEHDWASRLWYHHLFGGSYGRETLHSGSDQASGSAHEGSEGSGHVDHGIRPEAPA